jgi:hypothetical protein
MNGTASCTGGTCTIGNCNSPYQNCDGQYTSGCNIDLATDPEHCGSCGNPCTVMNGTASCTGGTCTIASCNLPHQNCDGKYSSGCNINLDTDPQNCGTCGNKCSAPNATSTCNIGTCAIAQCSAGFVNCNGVYADGCECAGTACCGAGGTSCQTVHSNGLGQHYYDCQALDTFNQTQAMEACIASGGTANTCVQLQCISGQTTSDVICNNSGAGNCDCWQYDGAFAGHVNTSCQCPSGADPLWN